MIKTQIQIPNEMYRDLKRLAVRQEWSLAEALRRGSELLLSRYVHSDTVLDWTPPLPQKRGWNKLNHKQIKEQAILDQELTMFDLRFIFNIKECRSFPRSM